MTRRKVPLTPVEQRIREAGPYHVESCANGTMLVTPAWSQFHCQEYDGGGPGLGTRLQLADDIAAVLRSIMRKRGA